jgi:hypothetical protein
LLEYRIGVTSVSRNMEYILNGIKKFSEGLDGLLVQPSGAAHPWIDGPGDLPTIESQFAEIAMLGAVNEGLEMPLESIRLAFNQLGPGEANEGFLRENSLGIIIVITDEDDCSRPDEDFLIYSDFFDCGADPTNYGLTSLAEYHQLLEITFGGPERYVFIAIAAQEACGSELYPMTCEEPQEYGGADKAYRLGELVHDLIGDDPDERGVFSDVCTKSMPDALSEALDKIALACDQYVIVE